MSRSFSIPSLARWISPVAAADTMEPGLCLSTARCCRGALRPTAGTCLACPPRSLVSLVSAAGFSPWILLSNIPSSACLLPLSPNLTAYAQLNWWGDQPNPGFGREILLLSLAHPFLFHVIIISGKLASLVRDHRLSQFCWRGYWNACVLLKMYLYPFYTSQILSFTANSSNSCWMQWMLFFRYLRTSVPSYLCQAVDNCVVWYPLPCFSCRLNTNIHI